MPSRKDLRVIQGGKPIGTQPATNRSLPVDAGQLLKRVVRYRALIADSLSDDIAGLINDLEDAVKALQRLERSLAPEAQARAAEYQNLIAEIDSEILAALQAFITRYP